MNRPTLSTLVLLVLAGCREAAPRAGETAAPAALPPPSTAPSADPKGTSPVPTVASMASTGAGATSTVGAWSFDADKVDVAPAGFSFGRTGQGKEGRWIVQAAGDAPSKPNVLVQADADATDYRFPVAVVEASWFKDVKLSVACKTISGNVDQACGLVWRFLDAKNYYLVRANALEDNVRLYHVKDGNRVQFASFSAKVAPKVWHRLAVEARGDRFVVTFDDKQILDAKDATFSSAGKVGVWTKADSITQFDDLAATPL